MPNPVAISVGVVAASVAVAAAITLYENPEVRRRTEDVRRRLAIALHSLGDNLDPSLREPRFNRPEDADGFLESRGWREGDDEVDEDERRQQREELMYWNAIRESKLEVERARKEGRESSEETGMYDREAGDLGSFMKVEEKRPVQSTAMDADTVGGLRRRAAAGSHEIFNESSQLLFSQPLVDMDAASDSNSSHTLSHPADNSSHTRLLPPAEERQPTPLVHSFVAIQAWAEGSNSFHSLPSEADAAQAMGAAVPGMGTTASHSQSGAWTPADSSSWDGLEMSSESDPGGLATPDSVSEIGGAH